MGAVCRARHAVLKRPTAVKLLLPDKAGAPHQVGPCSDLYGLGAVGYLLLVGSPVFGGKDAARAWWQARSEGGPRFAGGASSQSRTPVAPVAPRSAASRVRPA